LQARREWDTKKGKMDQNGQYVNAIFNKDTFAYAFVDGGCLCYMTVSSKFAKRAGLQRIAITPRKLQQVVGTQARAITEVAYGSLDIDGHQQDRVFAYIIPDQHEDIIIGLPWLRSEDAKVKFRKGYIDIRSTDTRVKLRNPAHSKTGPGISQCMSSVMQGLIRRAKKQGNSETVISQSPSQISKRL
jgi:predicted aspartyl protease